MSRQVRFARFSLAVLAVTMGVILWGAYVRATGSGAGCGSHWPTCNGEVIPRAPSTETIIEFTHRATSGFAFLLVLIQFFAAFRVFPSGHPVRPAAAASLVLMVTEAIVGAGLVIFEMVAGNSSTARGFWMIAHLLNTFALLYALVLTAWRARPRETGPSTSGASSAVPASVGPEVPGAWLSVGLGAVLVVAASGAIAALGDTLFPAASLQAGLAQDFSPGAHLFVRLRTIHPFLAVATAIYLLVLSGLVSSRDGSGRLRPLAAVVAGLVVLQMAVGLLNLVLLAPTALQIVHLLFADLLWMTLVVLAAAARELRARTPSPLVAYARSAAAGS